MRVVRDRGFRDWEVYATTGDFGLPSPARIVFRCRTDSDERPRVVTIEGDKSKAEALVKSLSTSELTGLLTEADVLS